MVSRLKLELSKLRRSYEPLNRVEVSRSAILHNFDLLKRLAKVEYVLPVLKSNAYGHGIKEVVSILSYKKFPYIAVDGYHEALEISRWSRQPVLVMGAVLPDNIPKIDLRRYAFGVQDTGSIAHFGKLIRPVRLHLEINTGMNRQGVEQDELPAVIKLLHEYPKLELEGVFSHFASADELKNDFTNQQTKVFDECVAQLKATGFAPRYCHISNSAGVTKVKSKFVNAIRPGISLYGINVLNQMDPNYTALTKLRPALAFYSRIIKLRNLKPGDTVSYNRTFTAEKLIRSAIIPAGYHEGVSRELSNKGKLKVNGHDSPILGRVCMNHTVLDVTGLPAKLWDEVLVLSNKSADANSIENLSRVSGTISYLLLEEIPNDVRRIVVD